MVILAKLLLLAVFVEIIGLIADPIVAAFVVVACYDLPRE